MHFHIEPLSNFHINWEDVLICDTFRFMQMKKVIFYGLAVVSMIACGNKKNIPDVSNIPVTVKVERFDKAFFATDTNNIAAGLYRLNQQFPYFFTDFTANILGVGVLSDTSKTAFAVTRQFLTSYLPVKDSIQQKFEQIGWLEKDLKRSFQFVKYYFPAYALPQKVVTYIGPFGCAGESPSRLMPSPSACSCMPGKISLFTPACRDMEMYPGVYFPAV